ncbi:MAG TPA: DUF4149 domain-containing protein [Candidatus Dormibacteraeota bacterium]|nr:DUF4149 domain-containing protein [Candidatus Dormibacteraeota bacterium]
MSTVLRTIEFLSLSLWLGADAFLSFVVAPGAFAVLASRDQAGAMVGYSLYRMHFAGVICGLVFLVARAVRTRGIGSLAGAAALCVVLMIALTVISQHAVSPRMAVLRGKMGSIERATASSQGTDNPMLAEFGKLHRVSVMLEGGVLLAGLAGMWFMVREMGRV